MSKDDRVSHVQCDRCQNWFEVPPDVFIRNEDLPEKWYCENNTWDSSHAVCPAFVGGRSGLRESPTNGDSLSFVPSNLRANVQSRSLTPGQTVAPFKRPPTHVFKQKRGGAEVPPEKRHQADVSGEPQDVRYTVVSLIEALQATIELVADYQGEEDELFSRINEIIARLEAVSRSSQNPSEGDKKALSAIIPNGLLIRLDREDGQNNPHLFTEETLRGILDCHNRADSAVAHFKDLVTRLKALSS